MSSFVGTPSLFFSFFHNFLFSNVFINIHEYYKIILYIISLGKRFVSKHVFGTKFSSLGQHKKCSRYTPTLFSDFH